MMKLLELQTKDPKSMTKEELEQACMAKIQNIYTILGNADKRVEREKNATANRR